MTSPAEAAPMSRRTQFVVGLLLAAVLIGWFLRRADLPQVVALLGAADLRAVALACLTVGLTSLQRAWRWRRLLAPLGTFAIRDLWAAIVMGAAVSLLPGRMGEVARPMFLAQRASISTSVGLGSVVLERILDVVAILMLLAAYLVLAPLPPTMNADGAATLAILRSVGMGLLLALLGLGIVALLVVNDDVRRARLTATVRRRMPAPVARLLVSFFSGMAGLRNPASIGLVMLSSLALWTTVTFTYVILFAAVDIAVPWYGAIPLLTLLVIGAAVPTPAGVGAFHKVAQLGLVGLFGVANDTAVAYAILSHAVAFLPVGAVGIALIVNAGMSSEVLSRLRKEPDAE
jgi:uncharacterized protein (TIRG00374 family)